jgi:hypothetical protein
MMPLIAVRAVDLASAARPSMASKMPAAWRVPSV